MSLWWLHVILYLKNPLSAQTQQNSPCSHLLSSTWCPHFVFTCKALAEARGMWHTGGGTSQPPTQDAGMIPLIHPLRSMGKNLNLVSQHSIIVFCETICWTHGRFFHLILQNTSSDGWDADSKKRFRGRWLKMCYCLNISKCSQDIMLPMAEQYFWWL